jgi:hypothetical protein
VPGRQRARRGLTPHCRFPLLAVNPSTAAAGLPAPTRFRPVGRANPEVSQKGRRRDYAFLDGELDAALSSELGNSRSLERWL